MRSLYLEATKIATLKVILLGSCNVGKTSIINKYVKGVFYEKPITTVGVDFAMKSIKRNELKQRSTSTCSDQGFQQQHIRNPDKVENIKDDSLMEKSFQLTDTQLITGEDVNL